MYEFIDFDETSNREQWRFVPQPELEARWRRDVSQGDKCALKGFGAWLYCRVTSGPLLSAEMLDWNMEVVK